MRQRPGQLPHTEASSDRKISPWQAVGAWAELDSWAEQPLIEQFYAGRTPLGAAVSELETSERGWTHLVGRPKGSAPFCQIGATASLIDS